MTSRVSSSVGRRLLVAGLVLVLPLAALADRGSAHDACDERGGRPLAVEMLPPYLQGIALSEGQRDKLTALMQAQAPAMRERADALRLAEGELQSLAFAGDFSEARAKTALETAGRAQAELAAARLRIDRQIAEVLTPEQRRQLQQRRPPRAPCGHGLPPPPRP